MRSFIFSQLLRLVAHLPFYRYTQHGALDHIAAFLIAQVVSASAKTTLTIYQLRYNGDTLGIQWTIISNRPMKLPRWPKMAEAEGAIGYSERRAEREEFNQMNHSNSSTPTNSTHQLPPTPLHLLHSSTSLHRHHFTNSTSPHGPRPSFLEFVRHRDLSHYRTSRIHRCSLSKFSCLYASDPHIHSHLPLGLLFLTFRYFLISRRLPSP